MKRFWLWLLSASLLGLPAAADAQQVKLRATLQVAVTESFLGVPLALLKEEVEKRTDKAVSIEIFDRGKLYVDTQVVDAVSSGAIEMGVAGTHMVAKRVPEINIVQHPFLLNFDALLRAATRPDSEMRKEIDAAVLEVTGARVLWWYSAGNTVFFSKGKDAAEPHAIVNQRVRVFSQLTEELTRRCGGKPTTVPVAKMLDAVKDGLVDLSMGAVNSVQTRDLWKVADIVTATNHAPVELLLLVNERAWQSLTPAHRDIIAAAARDVERIARDRMADNEAGSYAFAREKGMQVRTLTADEVAEWRACSASIVEDYMTQGELARRILLGYARLRTSACCSIDPGLAGSRFTRH